MSALHSIAKLAGSDFDNLTRSEARVTRRIGGGRQEIFLGDQWVPYIPPGPLGAKTEVCRNGHTVTRWNVESGYRVCPQCRSEQRARAAEKRKNPLASSATSHHT